MSKQSKIFSFFTKAPQVKKPNSEQIEQPISIKLKGKDIRLLDVVWAKLEGYPWWPAIVCKNPGDNSFIRKKKIHVQFFDEPPTRGWVKDSFVKPYGPPMESGISKCKDPLWCKARETAGAALALPIEERGDVIVCLTPSDEESDTNISDFNDSDKSKENVDINIIEGSEKKSVKRKDTTPNQSTSKKRRIVLLSESEVSEDEYKPVGNESDDDSGSSGVDEKEVSDVEMEFEVDSPVKIENVKRKRPAAPSKLKPNVSFTPISSSFQQNLNLSNVSDTTKSKLASFAVKETPTKSSKASGEFSHTKLSWLKPENITDKGKRKKDHPEYNPKTLYIPDEFLKNQTPAMRQWWVLKAEHFDIILFFKIGKFYEFYHMDAIVTIEELGLLMMKGGDHAHTGFPEIGYGRYSSTLIEKGYKVARVEQTETPDMMEKRLKSNVGHVTKFDKVVNRELCQISSRGTRLPSVINGDATSGKSSFLLSITERSKGGPGELRQIGVAFIDTSIGTFQIGQFEDDRHISRLRTLVAHFPPAQIIIDRGYLSAKVMQLVKASVPSTLQESLLHDTEYWTASKTLSFLAESKYFEKDSKIQWPQAFTSLASEGDSLGLTPHDNYELGLSALGGLLFYLRFCCMEEDLLTRKSFELYTPPDVSVDSSTASNECMNRNMIVDGTTLQNLEIFQNSSDGGIEGTLFERLSTCSSPFGKRLLHCWICSPLCIEAAINSRLDAIEDLRSNSDVFESLQNILKGLPDLEKLLSKIHSQGLKRNAAHPDTRAIMFEDQHYSKRKVLDFLTAVEGFKATRSIIDCFKGKMLKSALLKSCVTMEDEDGKFPDLKPVLVFFDNAFNHENAKKEGKIIPSEGVDPEYDEALSKIAAIAKELKDYLREQCKFFGASVTYFGSDKRRFQLEVPEHNAKRAGSEYELVTQKKGYKRFWTSRIKELFADIIVAEEQKVSALKDVARRIFQQFDEHAKEWSMAVECTSVLDVLMAFTTYSLQTDCSRPEIVKPTESGPFIEITEGRHPCSIKTFSGGEFIPNDVIMGCSSEESHAPLVLVTGPNMGGKSTLMRQTALICLLAQMGSYVPASNCRISPIDRIFTRLGAWDRIYKGESTFYVEMIETAAIMQHATVHSLVIIDELGRGTATFDGTAIACSVVDALIKIGCRTLFATHYHSLVDDFNNVEGVSQGHMACMVENEDAEDSSKESVVFLYKFAKGACSKSYGFNVARLAKLPEVVVKKASQKAKYFENLSLRKKYFALIFKDEFNREKIMEAIANSKSIL